MRQAKLKGWNRASKPQRLGAVGRCDLLRRGFTFECTQLFLPPEEHCSHCKTLPVQSPDDSLRN